VNPAAIPEKSLILLTGANGYVGGRLLRVLENQGYRVRCLARRPEILKQKADPSTEVIDSVCDEALESNHRLRLISEMNLPGRAWLEFEVTGTGSSTTIRQTAIADPVGLTGRLIGIRSTCRTSWCLVGCCGGISQAALWEMNDLDKVQCLTSGSATVRGRCLLTQGVRLPNGKLMTRIPVSKQILGFLRVCREWAIDPKKIERLELCSRIEQSMKRLLNSFCQWFDRDGGGPMIHDKILLPGIVLITLLGVSPLQAGLIDSARHPQQDKAQMIHEVNHEVEQAWEVYHQAALGGTVASPTLQADIEQHLHEARTLVIQAQDAVERGDKRQAQRLMSQVKVHTAKAIEGSKEQKK
jgi:hypothetical protein